MNQTSVIVIIPTYNNPETIRDVVNDVLNHSYKVIVIDDGSDTAVKDLFSEEEQKRIYFVRHDENQGKGQAIISGTIKAKELGYTHVLSMDGDGQHLASQAKRLIDVCDADEIIIGARNFDLEHVPFGSKFGRWFSNMWACWDTGYTIKDSLSGYRIYPVSILDLPIKTKRFDWEMEVLVRHADAGKKIKEVDIECYYPVAEERVSHFKKFEDTMAIVWVHVQILPFKWVKTIIKPFMLFKSN
ncbi:MAG TPA: glycosyltransferase family 2 protein [Sulfurovum sp.]|uniref:glycosyltransferase family 2 protein n=1 Tax=Sulfurovum sp. TaxID=1969726 RepID=UPI002F94B022